MAAQRTPSYCHHRATGQAVVRLDGRDYYLGKYGSTASRAEYDRLIAQWLSNGRSLGGPNDPGGLSINELILRYLEFARQHYQRDGIPTDEIQNIHHALKMVRKLYGLIPAAEFGPLALKTVRAGMLDTDLCRTTVNSRVGRIKRLFKWAVENELIPSSVHHGLSAVSGLRAGREGVRESKPVRPVLDDHVAAALPFMTAPVRAMAELQALTGMRPGEVTVMRADDIDRSGLVWVYVPERHKTQDIGHTRQILIGPQAQKILEPWLQDGPEEYLFSPAEAVEARNTKRRAERRTPMTPSQAKRKPNRNPKRPPRLRYDKNSYAWAIKRACDQAFPHPKLSQIKPENLTAEQRAELKAWQNAHRWSPNRLRHSLATKIRQQFGLEAAQVILGHARADVTQVYAERDRSKAAQVVAVVG
jgi:integrase